MPATAIEVSAERRTHTDADLAAIKAMCTRHGHDWVMEHQAFLLTANKADQNATVHVSSGRGFHEVHPGFFVIDPQMRGFVLVIPMDENSVELYFAIVEENHRRQGILRSMMATLESHLAPKTMLWLETRAETAECWKSLGFTECNYRHPSATMGSDLQEFEKVL